MSSTVDARIGSQEPRVSLLPNATGSAGPEAVELAALAGLHLDPWQQWCLDAALGEDEDHQWAAFEVAILVGRQNGKGSILEARQLAGLFLLNERLQVHTAHEFKTCFEHFLRMVSLIESTPELDKRVARIRRGAGEQAIELKTGERLRFLARSSGSGRGMSGDCVYLDEAFALTPHMMGALLPTLSARPNPQVWYTSSAPMATSEVLHHVVDRGRKGGDGRLFYAEWGNELPVDLEDVDAWYRANPAMGIRIDEEFVRAELEALRSMPSEFERERLGIPELPSVDLRPAKLPAKEWANTATGQPPDVDVGDITIGWEVTRDGTWASIGIGFGDIRTPYVELVEHRQGTGWLPARLVQLVQKWQPLAVGCINAGGSAAQVGSVLAAFREASIADDLLTLVSMTQYRAACGGMYSDVMEGRLHRFNAQGPLDTAVETAVERSYGPDSWLFESRSTSTPISPLVAVTIARALLPTEVDEDYDVLDSVL